MSKAYVPGDSAVPAMVIVELGSVGGPDEDDEGGGSGDGA